MSDVTAPSRPALRYYGGKWNLAPWIISHFPPHKNYVEPCGGAASVLLQKPRSPLETYNDLDGNVVNFFRVLRDRPSELVRYIRLTPWSRAEYFEMREPVLDELERARRFYCVSWMAISGSFRDTKSGISFAAYSEQRHSLINIGFTDLQTEHLYAVAKRLVSVQLENRPYGYILERYSNTDTLTYFDPPYTSETRSNPETYIYEWTDAQHAEAAALLRSCAGYVIVSGYACPLYADLYEAYGWVRRDQEAQTNSGGKRIESLWLSPHTWQALQAGAGLPLFQAIG